MDTPDAEQFAKMALEMHEQRDVGETLELIVEYAKDTTSCDEAGLMEVHAKQRIETVLSTGPRVDEADRLQMACGEGPCVNAIWDRDMYVVDDAATDPRWPLWGPRAAALGFRSMIAVRLFTPNRTLGSLNLFGERPGQFTDDDADIADIFGRHASVALAAAHEEEGLRHAISARHLIGQAQGMLMERYGLDADRAFALLRRHSQDNNIKLRDVAQQVIATGTTPGTPGS